MIALSHVILVLPVALLLKLWESALPLNVPGEHAPDTVTEQLSPVARPDRLKLTHPPLFIRPPRLPLSVIFGPELFVEATSAGSARSLHPPLQPELLQPKAPEFLPSPQQVETQVAEYCVAVVLDTGVARHDDAVGSKKQWPKGM